VTLQAFLTDEGPLLSEINPRFGGGFPLTLAAGGDYPEWIMQMLEGRCVPPRLGDYEVDLYMTRYHAELIGQKPLWR
jgi:carbamoyl-phosphate synthase large subunit